VITLQNISYPIIQDEYRNHDLFILPSKPTQYWQEQYGMVLVEAMACGLPIITTTCGAIPEVVGDSALLVPHSNAPKLYGALKTMIDQPLLRRQYRMRSLDRVKKYYNSKFVADKINDVYMNCINRRKL
jgi:glycosyltransferase involved in cell wall biosynthesis